MRFVLLLVLAIAGGFVCAAKPPGWAVAVSQIQTPDGINPAPAVVLCDETKVVISENGTYQRTHRYAIRILNLSGRAMAHGEVYYVENESEIQSARAWIVRGGKEIKPNDRIEWIDAARATLGEVYSEVRTRVCDFSDFALEGDVFGYETVVSGKLTFPQLDEQWEAGLPVVSESYSVVLPRDWAASVIVHGPAAHSIVESKDQDAQTWTMRGMPYYPEEPMVNEELRVQAKLLITLTPSTAAPKGQLPAFHSWSDLNAWLIPMLDRQCDSSSGLVETTRQLTAGCTDQAGKIRAIAKYVQALRYVAYDRNLAQGMGFCPRKASEVFTKGWGDCKAKANLMRAMLRIAGVDSYLVAASVGGGRSLAEAWPSPHQFDHMIIAIKTDQAAHRASEIDVQGLGSLMFFDPTDPFVRVGDLPNRLQGTHVLVVAPGINALSPLPCLPPRENHRWDQITELALQEDGSVVGKIRMAGIGSAAATARGRHQRLSAPEYRKYVGEVLSQALGNAKIDTVQVDDEAPGDGFSSEVAFAAPRFAQSLPGGMVVARLDVFGRGLAPSLQEKERHLPVLLNPVFEHEEIRLTTPAGYAVDELPKPQVLSSPFGRYESRYVMEDGVIKGCRELCMDGGVIPVADYAALRKFLSDVAKANRASAILRRGQ